MRHFAIVLALLLVSGCKQILYSDLGERQANDMVAVLASVGIESTRNRDKKNIYTISVHSSQVAAAITVLKNHGLPKDDFKSLGDVFSADGIVGTPFEERARFAHAMNEELSHTISEISGVRAARVHIMLPEVTRYRTVEQSARASVVVHVEPDFPESEFLPTIKNLVVHSIANLEYENVAVAVFPSNGPIVVPDPVFNGAGSNVAQAGQAQPLQLNTQTPGLLDYKLVLLFLVFVIIAWSSIQRLGRTMRIRWRGNE
jgi:type III secretion protein J